MQTEWTKDELDEAKRSTVLRQVVRAFLAGHAVTGGWVTARFELGRGLVFSLDAEHKAGPLAGAPGAKGVFEAAEQVYHLAVQQDTQINLRCRHCGALGPVFEVETHDRTDKVYCEVCGEHDQLRYMQGVEPSCKPSVRHRRQSMVLSDGGMPPTTPSGMPEAD